MNVSFTHKQETYSADQVASGDYQNASEVVRDALRLHALYRAKAIEEWRTLIGAAWDGPISPRSVEDIIIAKGQKRAR